MALHVLRSMLHSRSGERDLTEVLPLPEQMRWIPFPAANGSYALVIGGDANSDIVAFATVTEDGNSTVAYSKCVRGSNTGPPLTQEEVMELPLLAPFNYNNKSDSSPQGSSSFSSIATWYLLAVPDNGLLIHNDEFLPSFYEALQNVELGQQLDAEAITGRSERYANQNQPSSSALQDFDHPNLHDQVSAHAGSLRNSATPTSSPRMSIDKVDNQDLSRLMKGLRDPKSEQLLKQIPGPGEITFEEQTDFPEMVARRLLVGWEKPSGNAIYAYMRSTRGSHVINFFARRASDHDQHLIQATHLALHHVMFPFNKVFPENVDSIETRARRRLTVLVKWYFIAAGIVRDRILKETKDFPKLFREALEYIARRTQCEGSVASSAITVDTVAQTSNGGNTGPCKDEMRTPLHSLSETVSQWSTANEDLPILAEGVEHSSPEITTQAEEHPEDVDDVSPTVDKIFHDIEMSISDNKAEDDKDRKEQADIRKQVKKLEQKAQIINRRIISRKQRLTKSRNELRRGTGGVGVS